MENLEELMRDILRHESQAILDIPVTDGYGLSLIHISEPTRP